VPFLKYLEKMSNSTMENTTPSCRETIIIATSTDGDWVRVTQGDRTLHEGHSIGTCHLTSILEDLGFKTENKECPPEEFE
jgi:hypothetical protein